jgi:hypothetical protein
MPHCFKLAHRISRFRPLVIGSFVVAIAACSDALGPVQDSDPADIPTTTDSPTAPVVETPSLATTRPGIPFGFWQMDYGNLNTWITSLKRTGSPSSIRKYLDYARSKGARVYIQFAGSKDNYRNSDGTFSLSKFNALLDRYKDINLSSYIQDGTLAGHMMIDEPSDGSNWDGDPMPYSQVEAAAKHSKEVFPGLATVVRATPVWLRGASFRWQYLDAAWAQYSARKGNVYNYRDAELNAAKDEGLGLIFGLNVIDGGDGSSGWRGSKDGRWKMSPDELRKYGRAFINVTYSCAFMMWRYEDGYMSKSSVLSAMKEIGYLAKDRDFSSCKKS